MQDNELIADFVVEANEHLADIENQFLAIEEAAPSVDADLVNEVFRAIHSIKGAAGFLGLTTVNDLAHNLENVLNMMRNDELAPTSAIVDDMLKGADALKSLIEDVENSNSADVTGHITALEKIAAAANGEEVADEATPEPAAQDDSAGLNDADPEEIDLDAAIEAKFAEARAAAAAAAADDQEEVVEEVQEEAQVVEEPVPAPVAEPEPVPIPEPEAPQVKENKPEKSAAAAKPAAEQNIRVAVGVLDSLMNLAGELVLSRNQLLQAVSTEERTGIEAISARLDQITSELQEAIMQTRMQQIGTVFGRFPRVVRDLSSKLGKQVDLQIEGKDVEVDKTIVEAIGDPLTHLIRNSVDHGIESPEERVRNGKHAKGTINLNACYQAGKVRIEIIDDGGGIDPEKLKQKALSKNIITPEQAERMSEREAIRLIFAPGFSTAAQVTDVSGRGVGMDVVRTNIAKLGGTVDVESTLGQGTSIVVTLPLTLAIIPSLIVQVGEDRFAIPQVNIAELVRVRASERSNYLGRVKDAEVLRRRGQLLPLVRPEDAFNFANKNSASENLEATDQGSDEDGATNIIIVDTGQSRFGLVVDALHDSEEIVVKPLGRHHKNCRQLAGATILGDGHVALILDIAGIAADVDLRSDEELREDDVDAEEDNKKNFDMQSVLLFRNHEEEHFVIPMDIIARIERIRFDQIDSVAGQEVLQYRKSTLPLMRLENWISAKPAEPTERVFVVVFDVRGREVGLLTPHLTDIRDIPTDYDTVTFREQGITGSVVHDEKTIRMVDLFELTELAHPDWFIDEEIAVDEEGLPPLVLLAEDSGFFRTQVKAIIEDRGYRVVDCEDGLEAWGRLSSEQEEFDVIVTDIEMPNMNGFEFCQKVKGDSRFNHLPVIALTSLAGQADMAHGMEVGIDDYQIKMDREKLLNSIQNFAGQAAAGAGNQVTVGSH